MRSTGVSGLVANSRNGAKLTSKARHTAEPCDSDTMA
jgi:hypothetical protein